MSRDFYFFGRAFLGLATFCSLLQTTMLFLLGQSLGNLQIFHVWYLVAGFVHVGSAVFVLKYLLNKKYLTAFAAGILVVVSLVLQMVVVFLINLFINYYLPLAYLLVGTSLLFAIVLIFSRTREKPWLKWAGIILLVSCMLYVVIFVLMVGSIQIPGNSIVMRLSQWASLVGSLVPVAYIMNFRDEERILRNRPGGSYSRFAESFLTISFIAAFIASSVSGFKLATQGTRAGVITMQATKMSQQFEARTYVSSDGESMQYRLLRPLDYDSTIRYPLAVCLHGGAGWGTDNVKQFDGSLEAQLLCTDENRKKYPAFVFVPQCPPGTSWGGVPGLRNVDSLVFEIIDTIEREFSIDTHRRYVMGHSLGGYGTWYFIGTRPGIFAAAIPSAGFGDPSFGESIVDVSVWAFHGRLDRNVSVNGSRDIIEAIRNAGGDPKYTEYPYIGHGTWEPMKSDPEIMEWLFAQRRK